MRRYAEIAEYYDAEYAQLDMLQSDVPFFLDHLPRRRSVLELACGTGRAAISIAQAGHRVAGIDSDAGMLDLARRKRDAVGLGDRQVELRQGDILDLDLGRRFDCVCLFFNTFLLFTTLQQQDQALRAVRRHLDARGCFWLDVFQPNVALLAQERSANLEPTLFYVPELDRTVFKSTEVRRDPARQVERITYHYLWFDSFGREHRRRRSFELTFLFPRELQLLLERNGLYVERVYGNYDGSELDADSPRMIVCARPVKS